MKIKYLQLYLYCGMTQLDRLTFPCLSQCTERIFKIFQCYEPRCIVRCWKHL